MSLQEPSTHFCINLASFPAKSELRVAHGGLSARTFPENIVGDNS
jgi:hypothetical protein